MSDNNDITRRKALSASAGIGGAVIGIPAGVAGQSSGIDDSREPGLQELKKALRESEHFVANPEAYRKVTEGSLSPADLGASATPEDPEIYFGEYKNAEAPSGKYAAVGSPAELQQRDVPLSLEGEVEDRLVAEGDAVQPEISDFFYFEEDLGTISLGAMGHSIDVGVAVGAGLQIDLITSDLQVGATLSADIELSVNGFKFTVSPLSFGVSAGPGDHDGYCIGPIGIDWGYLPGGEVELCGAFRINTKPDGDITLEVGINGLEVCADPCPGISCPVCASPIASSFSFETKPFDPDDFI